MSKEKRGHHSTKRSGKPKSFLMKKGGKNIGSIAHGVSKDKLSYLDRTPLENPIPL